jgi:DNA repair exonuclease SbcCD ATPase subunit
MGKPAYKIQEDYEEIDQYFLTLVRSNYWKDEEFDQHILTLVRSNWKDIWTSDLQLERRFSNLEKGQEQLLIMVQNMDENLRLYREDSKHFMEKTEQAHDKFRQEIKADNEKFRQEIREDNEKFRQETNKKFETIDQRFEKLDQRFEKLDQRFDTINQQFINVHKVINRMTVFFISGLGVIVLLAKLLDKVWP